MAALRSAKRALGFVAGAALIASLVFGNTAYASTSYGFGTYGSGTYGGSTTSTSPTVTTGAASSVSALTAVLNGSITADGGASSTVRGFNIGLTASYGATTTESGTFGVGSFSTTTTGLTSGTTYHYRAYATNGVGTTYGSDQTFSTLSVSAPTVTTSAASSVGDTSAILNGAITSDGNASSTVRGFVFGLTTSYGATTTANGTFGVGSFTYGETGLAQNTTYHFKAYATNSAGTSYGSDQTFTTSATPDTTPPAISGVGSSVSATTATITWTTDEAASSTVKYGATTSYGSSSTSPSYVTSHSIILTGLSSGTTYHYQVGSADVSNNVATSSDQTFTTLTVTAPTVTTSAATGVGLTGATFNGAITSDGNASSTARGFQYGLTTSYTATSSAVGTFGIGSFSATVNSLATSTTYHYRAFATNGVGTSFGSDQTFTTATPDTTPPVISGISSGTPGSTSAVITWTTDEGADSKVLYSTSATDTPATTPLDSTLVTSHSVTVSGLTPSTLYYFSVRSADASGNAAVSSTQTFTTASTTNTTDTESHSHGGQSVSPVASAGGGPVVVTVNSDGTVTVTPVGSTNTGYGGGTMGSAPAISRDLTTGSTGTDVTALQAYLIYRGYSIPAGATGYFGAQTVAALAAFQAANGIVPASGYFGPLTRAVIAATGGAPATSAPSTPVTTTTTTTTTTTAATGSFTRDLTVGSTGTDVMALQQYLNDHGYTVATTGPGSAGNETTTFGAATKAALAKLQAVAGISPAAGYFGSLTRAYVASH